jgi:putative Holliday junction resolvase
MRLDNSQESLERVKTGRILGIDYGRKRIGLAISDPFQMLASTFKTVPNAAPGNTVLEIAASLAEFSVSAIVLGLPMHMSGEKSDMAKEIDAFAAELEAKIDAPIFLWDERWTTQSAEKLLIETGRSPSKSRQHIDQVAAAFLLQNFLDRLAFAKKQTVE